MMVVNLANAVRLQKRMDDAKVILQKEDWTAIGDDFKLCVAAVRGEVDEVVKIMEALGANGPVKAEDYRSWPVFRGMRTNEKFAQAFQKIFGGMLLQPKKVEIDPPPSQASKSLTLLSEDGLAVQ
ncbi:MAG TPA: hypothetical protein VHX92_01575 [Rhizomicrobium sp.]|nr:hypothetical protein [Rhizomicrobium sp.]